MKPLTDEEFEKFKWEWLEGDGFNKSNIDRLIATIHDLKSEANVSKGIMADMHKHQDTLRKEIESLKGEVQLRWNEGEAAISECAKLRHDIRCLEESTVDMKAWDKQKEELKIIVWQRSKLEEQRDSARGVPSIRIAAVSE